MLFKEELAIANAATSSAGNHGGAQNVMNVSGGGGTTTPSTVEALAAGFKNTEVISILKRRNNSSENVNDNLKYTTSTTAAAAATASTAAEDNSLSLHSQTYSDSSLQKYGDDDHLGHNHDDEDDDESDSDWDGFPVSSSLASSQFVFISMLNFIRFFIFFSLKFRTVNEVAVDLICPMLRVRFFEKFPTFCSASMQEHIFYSRY